MATAMMQRAGSRESDQRRPAPEPVTEHPLLIATDGSAASDAAVRAARAIAAVTGQKVVVLAVHVPLPMMGPEVQIATSPDVDGERRAALQSQLEEQIERVGITDPWPEHVFTGSPAATIAKFATSIDASLIVMGLGGHTLFERMFGDEMVLQVLRVSTVPVFAVAPDFSGLPSRAIAAVDFSASSGRALALAGNLVTHGGEVTLAHVVSTDQDSPSTTSADAAYIGWAGRALDHMIAESEFADSVSCEHSILLGDPAQRLLELAGQVRADLIITGSHGNDFLSRLLLGSVSTRLVRKAGCSILVAPPLEGPEFVDELADRRGRFAFYEWTERLEEFTRRNGGQFARLEVIDPDIGAQVEENHAPFVGASFDPRDGRVHLMFGSREGGGHLTRSIDGVTCIKLLRDQTGDDASLSVAHGRGQTLLTLER